MSATREFDVLIAGAGAAGLTAALFAAERGARVCLVEGSTQIGGTLHIAGGRMSAAGTKLQRAKGIADTPQEHYDDVMRICRGTADPVLLRLAVENAAATLDWLCDRGFPVAPECPAYQGGTHDPYLKQRVVWGLDSARSALKVLEGPFHAQVAAGRVALRLETTLAGLLQDPDGTVRGGRVRGPDGSERAIGTGAVLIATGGYAANGALVRALHGCDQVALGSQPTAQGDALALVEAVGGYVRGQDFYHASFGAVLADYDYPSPIVCRAHTKPQVRQPWEIYVGSDGRRFVAEDHPSVDLRERALIDLADRRYWILFDEGILAEAPPLIDGWTTAQIRGALGNHPMFQCGDTLADLAAACGMPPAALAETVAAYNDAFEGADPLGRRHRPRRLGEGPFYAIRQHCTLQVATAGVMVDGSLRVIRRDGSPIPNLYAAGEALGSVATMGDSGAFGMLVTPALTFGRLLGERLLQWELSAVAEAAE